jgi:hypothetical protein
MKRCNSFPNWCLDCSKCVALLRKTPIWMSSVQIPNYNLDRSIMIWCIKTFVWFVLVMLCYEFVNRQAFYFECIYTIYHFLIQCYGSRWALSGSFFPKRPGQNRIRICINFLITFPCTFLCWNIFCKAGSRSKKLNSIDISTLFITFIPVYIPQKVKIGSLFWPGSLSGSGSATLLANCCDDKFLIRKIF